MIDTTQAAEKAAIFLAGVLGGLVRFVFSQDEKETLYRSIAYVVCGGICAFYLGPALIDYMEWEQHFISVFGFLIGFGALNLAKAGMKLLDKIEQSPEIWWSKFFKNGKNGN